MQAIIRELRGEKIDIIEWSDEPSVFAANALSPAKVNKVRITDIDNRQMEVIVNEDQLSLAIGKRGQNVRLATKLVGWNIDIRSEEEITRAPTKGALSTWRIGAALRHRGLLRSRLIRWRTRLRHRRAHALRLTIWSILSLSLDEAESSQRLKERCHARRTLQGEQR